MRNDLTMRLRLGLIAGACALLTFGNIAHAQQAQDDDDEDTFEQRIIKGILGGLGAKVGGSGIDYRERSPLVIPPSMDLPPPNSSAAATANNPAWPKAPERKKVAAKNVVNRMAGAEDPGTSARLTPDELRRGINPRAPRVTDPSKSGSQEENDIGRPLRPNELGTGGIFNWKALTGNNGTETATFDGEPARGSLTDPPTGYQTPSRNQPYGAASDTRGGWKIPTILSRPEGSADN